MDLQALQGLNDHLSGHAALAHALAVFSDISPFLMVAALVGLWLAVPPGSASRLRQGVIAAPIAAALALALNAGIAAIWTRPRPSMAHPGQVHLWFTGASADPSFPSDHSSAAFAVAFAILLVSWRAGLPMIVLAAAIAVSRVAIGLHYPTDVLAGVLVGLAAAALVTWLGRRPIEWVAGRAGALTDRITAPAWRACSRRIRGHA